MISTKKLIKGSTLLLVFGVAMGIYLQVVITPKAVEAYDNFVESFHPTMTYISPVAEETPADRVEIYFEEEFEKLQEKYEQAQKDEARLNAMERVEAEFESEKELIRERELFISAPVL